MLQRTLPAGFIAPCLPTKTDKLPSGSQWLHEIKHDGFRIIARKDGPRVRLYSRPGNDLTHRFRLIVETLARLCSRSCIIDGEAVACDDNGIASFDLVRHHRANDGGVAAAWPLGALLIIAALVAAIPALAHSWYPLACCGKMDCFPVACDQLVETGSGWFYVPTGNLFKREQVQASQDTHCHVCLGRGREHRSICAFIVPNV